MLNTCLKNVLKLANLRFKLRQLVKPEHKNDNRSLTQSLIVCHGDRQ
ncbi:Uncharacterised protein [Vibrio cholerae]|nr:Uncharacterised protein [Vibrio cholerae]CSC60683.1 Uncharacterised protein [Vibrio cholerae]CSD06365.1 Uncharacterised protein [Vibrio cholerae]CSD53530.1 Uncharacterised protein [Vibrio cholerae]